MNVAYINPFIVASNKVFQTMIHLPITLGKPHLKGHEEPQYVVSAMIGMSGNVVGSVVIGFSQPVAMALASGLIGSPIKALDSDCIDALGEIANMIAGSAKTMMPGSNTISLPNVVLGNHRVAQPSGVPTIVIPCEVPQGKFVIEVAIRETAKDAKVGAA